MKTNRHKIKKKKKNEAADCIQIMGRLQDILLSQKPKCSVVYIAEYITSLVWLTIIFIYMWVRLNCMKLLSFNLKNNNVI